MNISNQGLNLIIHYETGGHPEKYLTAYWDAHGKVWTIGIGSTIKSDGTSVQKDDKITLDEAYEYLNSHLNKAVIPGLNAILPNLKQNEFDALASFIYNLGMANFRNSTLLRKIKAKASNHEIATEFSKWNKAGEKVLQGLIKRRKSEAELFTTAILNLY